MIGKILAVLTLLVSASVFAANDEYTRVEIKGTLHNDFQDGRATLKANGVTYELDFGQGRELARQAEKYDRKQVVVSGSLFVENARDGGKFLIVTPERIVATEPVPTTYEERRTIVREPRERVIIRESDPPVFKLGPLEIND